MIDSHHRAMTYRSITELLLSNVIVIIVIRFNPNPDPFSLSRQQEAEPEEAATRTNNVDSIDSTIILYNVMLLVHPL
jgi:hypothetical protein